MHPAGCKDRMQFVFNDADLADVSVEKSSMMLKVEVKHAGLNIAFSSLSADSIASSLLDKQPQSMRKQKRITQIACKCHFAAQWHSLLPL